MWSFLLRIAPKFATCLGVGGTTLVLCVVSFLAGAWLTHDYHVDKEKERAAEASAAIVKTERTYNEKLSNVINQLDATNNDLINLRAANERLRVASRATRAATSAPGGVDAQRLAQCENLLRESTELLFEGSELLHSVNAKKEGLIELQK